MYDEVLNMLKDATKDYGTLLAFYEIEVKDNDDHLIHDGPFEIKIKITDEMKKYNTFKIIYVEMDEELILGDPITLTVDGDYLVGTLDHLSTYALTGEYIEPKKDNPQTGDNIYRWIGILGISGLGLSIGTTIIKKNKKSNTM